MLKVNNCAAFAKEKNELCEGWNLSARPAGRNNKGAFTTLALQQVQRQ